MSTALKTFPLVILALLALTGCPDPANDDDVSGDCNLLSDSAPVVVIDEPGNAELVGAATPINWLVRVTDEDSPVDGILLEALDLTDGTPQDIDFDVPSPGADGRSEFTLSGDILGTGVVVVRIVATDEVGCSSEDQVVLCIDVDESECDFEAR